MNEAETPVARAAGSTVRWVVPAMGGYSHTAPEAHAVRDWAEQPGFNEFVCSGQVVMKGGDFNAGREKKCQRCIDALDGAT